MKCKICNCESKYIFNAEILNKYDVKYYKCISCGFLQTETPYWLEDAYSDSISVSDTGVIKRNYNLAKTSSIIFSILFKKKGFFLDYGGGYGIFTRIMRDKGFNYFWYDKFTTNLVARGFEGSIAKGKYSAVTSFENFEHFENPIIDIEKIFSLTDTVLFSTSLVPDVTPTPNDWWYFCLEHGQHISLFSKKSLEFVAHKYKYNFVSNNRNLHIFSKKKISKNIFLIEKILRKLKLNSFFEKSSKTDDDMNMMIEKMRNRCKPYL